MSLASRATRTVVITGAAGGLGRELGRAFAGQGDRVYGLDVAPLDSSAGIFGLQTDITDPLAVRTAFQRIVEEAGEIDVLINNAAVRPPSLAFSVATLEAWQNVFDVNVTGTFLVSKAAVEHMSSDGGVIVNVASQLAYAALPGHAAYGASKAAIVHLTTTMALELAEHGIRVFGVAPGVIETEMTQQLRADPKWVQQRLGRIPANRFATATEIAAFILRLTGPEADYVRGTTVVIDGGYTSSSARG